MKHKHRHGIHRHCIGRSTRHLRGHFGEQALLQTSTAENGGFVVTIRQLELADEPESGVVLGVDDVIRLHRATKAWLEETTDRAADLMTAQCKELEDGGKK